MVTLAWKWRKWSDSDIGVWSKRNLGGPFQRKMLMSLGFLAMSKGPECPLVSSQGAGYSGTPKANTCKMHQNSWSFWILLSHSQLVELDQLHQFKKGPFRPSVHCSIGLSIFENGWSRHNNKFPPFLRLHTSASHWRQPRRVGFQLGDKLSTSDSRNAWYTGSASFTLCSLVHFLLPVSNHLGPCSLPLRSHPKSVAREILHMQVRSSTITTSKIPKINDWNGH